MTRLVKNRRTQIYILLFFSAVAFLYSLPIYQQINNWGIQDWDLHLFYNGVPRVTILEYGQFPLWNPWFLGGSVMLAHPESQFLTPGFLFVLLFGEVVGLKLSIWLHLVIGLLGCYALGRHYRLGHAAATMIAFVFMLNSMFALAFTVGMTWFLPVAWLPWAFLFYLKGFDNWQYGLVSGFFLTLMFFTGAAYPLPIALLFFGVYGLMRVLFRDYGLLKLIRLLAIIVLFTICLGAIKFFPSIEFSRTYPRTLYDYSGYSLNSLRYSLFSRDQSLEAIANLPVEQPGFFTGVTAGMDENGIYIGLVPFALFVLGIGLQSKQRLILFVTCLIFLWISLGNRPRAEVWTLLHLVPFYKAMRIAQRFRIIVMLCVAILAGFGFQTVGHYLHRKIPNGFTARALSAGLLLFVLVDLIGVSWFVFKDAFSIPPLEVPKSETFYQISTLPPYDSMGFITEPHENEVNPFGEFNQFHIFSSYGSVYPAFLANIGTIEVITSTPVPREAIPNSAENYRGEVFLTGTKGSVSIRSWSPNRVVIDVDVLLPGHLVLNQNYYDGWHVAGDSNRAVESVDQLLAIPVRPDDKQLELYYRPAGFVLGVAVTAITILFCIGFAGWQLLRPQPHFLRSDDAG